MQFVERIAEIERWIVGNDGVKDVTITGGEPLVVAGILSIIGRLRRAGKNLTIYTNGTLLDDVGLENVLRNGISKIRISVDSVSQRCNGRLSVYEQIGDWAKQCHAAGVLLEVGVTVTAGSEQAVEDIFRIRTQCLQLGILFSISPEFPQKKIKCLDPIPLEQLAVLMELKYLDSISNCLNTTGRFSCSATRDLIAILPDGRVSPCDNMAGSFLSKESILDIPLDELLETDRNMSTFRKVAGSDLDVCRDCVYQLTCNGGCRAMAYLCGDLDGCDPYARQRLGAYYQIKRDTGQ